MRATFIVPQGVDLPPMKADDGGPQFHYRDTDGNLAGGYSEIATIFGDAGVRYEFDASPESIAAWKAGGVYRWVEDLPDGQPS